jgi:hypothetical protein
VKKQPKFKEWKSRTIASGANAKTVKGDDTYITAVMYLAPYTSSLAGNVCPMALTAGCIDGCLNTSGRAAFTPSILPARVAKTQRYFADRAAFMAELVRDISNFLKHCKRNAAKPAVRLNGTSDIQWEVAHPCFRNGQRFASIMEAFPEVQFYDYTKIYKRAYRTLPSNYVLTLSYSAANAGYAAAITKAAADTGCNVAVVYRTKAIRNAAMAGYEAFNGMTRRVIDGDKTDMRFLDELGVIVGLYAKGKAKKDTSGFVID